MIFVKSLTVLFLVVILIISNNISSMERVWADSLIKTIEVNNFPSNLVYNPVNNYIYLIHSSASGSSNITVIDSSTNEVIDTIEVEGDPFLIDFNPSNNNVY